MGPNSRAVLSAVTDADLSNAGFEFGTGRSIKLAGVDVFALRMSYVGDLGWELYIPNADAVGVYDALIEEGRLHGWCTPATTP